MTASKKLGSLLVFCRETLWVNVNAAGYHNEGMLLAMASGCSITYFENEPCAFISIDDAIKLNQEDLAHPDASQPEKDYRLATITQFERFKRESESGIHDHRNSDNWVLAYERYWDSKKGHAHRRKALNAIRKNRPDLFPPKRAKSAATR